MNSGAYKQISVKLMVIHARRSIKVITDLERVIFGALVLRRKQDKLM